MNTTTSYTPISMDELAEYWRKVGYWRIERDEPDGRQNEADYKVAVRVSEARRAAEELAQESWISGVPADATIHCAAHDETRPAHGANTYDTHTVCNECVEEFEVAVAYKDPIDFETWLTNRRASCHASRFIDNLQAQGEGCYPLPDGRWADVQTLYAIDADGSDRQPHWPLGYYPTSYRVFVRSDWQPGEFGNNPDVILIIQDRRLLFTLFVEGSEAMQAQHQRQHDPRCWPETEVY